MPTVGQQLASNLARTGGVRAQIAMGDQRLRQAESEAQQGQFDRQLAQAMQLAQMQDQIQRDKMAMQESQFGRQFGLDERRLGMQGSQFDRTFGLEEQKAMREQQKFDMEQEALSAMGGVYGSMDEAEDGFAASPMGRSMLEAFKAGKINERQLALMWPSEMERWMEQQANAAKTGTSRKDMIKGEMDLRKEFDALGKEFRDIESAFNRVETTGSMATPAGDLALIFNYMKMLDPGSVVRESEFRTASQAKAWLSSMDGTGEGFRIPSMVRLGIQRMDEGTLLLPEQRDDFLGAARGIFQGQADIYNQRADVYRGFAQDYGYDPNRIARRTAAGGGGGLQGNVINWDDL